MAIFRLEPPPPGVECRGVWKSYDENDDDDDDDDFRPISRFILEIIQDGAIVAMEI